MPRDPATDPNLDLREHPQDPQARQPGERLGLWLARRCSPDHDAPWQIGDPSDEQRPRDRHAEREGD